MTRTRLADNSTVEPRRLIATLEDGLAKCFGNSSQIIELKRRPSPYRTSFALEELKVRLRNGMKLKLLFKNCGRNALSAEAAHAKPAFLSDPARELEVYAHFLEPADFGTAVLYGSLVDEPHGVFGLFLEHVRGRELYQFGELRLWEAAARWLARFHAHFRAAQLTVGAGHLLRLDANLCRTWLERANRMVEESDIPTGPAAAWISIFAAYVATIDRLSTLPATLIHGEFFASNVLVADSKRTVRICPIDWEMGGVGPGLLDLAALVAGSWSEDQKATLARTYREEFESNGLIGWETEREFWFDVSVCRLHLAVQRIGWASEWTPPPEHRNDWWDDAAQLARKIIG